MGIFKDKTKANKTSNMNKQKINTNKSTKNSNINTMVNVVLAGLTSFSIINALAYTLIFDYSPAKLLAVTFFVVIIYAVIFLNKYSLAITGISAAVIIFSQLTYLIHEKTLGSSLKAISAFIQWNLNYIKGYEELDKIYQNYTILFFVIVISLLIYIFTEKYFNFLIIFSGIFVFVIQWMLNYTFNNFSFYLFVFLVILYYLKHIHIKNSQKSDNNYANPAGFILYILPFCLLVFIVSFTLPESSKPIEWKWLDKKVNKVHNYFNDIFRYSSYDYYSFKSTGFEQDDNRLGGKVRPDKTPVLSVESSRRIYLKGAGRDIYTGHSWDNSSKDLNYLNLEHFGISTEVKGDKDDKNSEIEAAGEIDSGFGIELDNILEPLIGINLLTENLIENSEDFLEENEVTITYLNLKTKTLFTPSGILDFAFPATVPEEIYIDQEGMLSVGEKLIKGFQYTLNTYNLKQNDDKVKELLKRSYNGLYNNILKNYMEYSNRNYSRRRLYKIMITGLEGEKITIEPEYIKKLSEKSDDIYSKYLQLPDNLPKRITDLTISITSKKDNDYDKVKSIEEYLSRNFPYTLKLRPTPIEYDFVDFFLFDLKEGYCTYFATAMTVMLRSIGIPARYVEGYMLPHESINNNTYTVTNENAHAWVEVYFEGFGWISFEPTPPFMSSFYRSQGSGTISSEFAYDPYYMEYMQMLEMFDSSFLEGLPSRANVEYEKDVINYKKHLIRTFIIALLLIIVTSTVNLIRNKLKYIKLKNMLPKKSVLETAAYCFNLLFIQGYPIMIGETPLEYSKRINRYFVFEKFSHKDEEMESFITRIHNEEQLYIDSVLSRIIDIFLLARYSNTEITQKQKDTVLDFYDRLIAETKDSIGILKYFIYRYILGKL